MSDQRDASIETKKSLQEFYLADFKDLSDKLEKTDGKIQFFVQLYIGIVTVSVGLLAEKLMPGGHYGFSGLFWLAISVMGFFVMSYALAGMKLHRNYVNRLNHLRRYILLNQGRGEKYITDYGYTRPVSVNREGMTYWMIRFLKCATSGFFGMFIYCFANHYGDQCGITDRIAEMLAIAFTVVIFLGLTVYNHCIHNIASVASEMDTETSGADQKEESEYDESEGKSVFQ